MSFDPFFKYKIDVEKPETKKKRCILNEWVIPTTKSKK
jgi:hypothetical protein